MQSLANRLVLHKSSLTRLIDRMEAAELVVRIRCDNDNRGLNAALTKEGRDALRRALPAYQRSVQRNFAQHLTDSDVLALQRVLSKLLAANGRT
jgi:DNA-binding MarR family transcriptional regulator